MGCMPAGPSALLGFRERLGKKETEYVHVRDRERGRPADNPN